MRERALINGAVGNAHHLSYESFRSIFLFQRMVSETPPAAVVERVETLGVHLLQQRDYFEFYIVKRLIRTSFTLVLFTTARIMFCFG